MTESERIENKVYNFSIIIPSRAGSRAIRTFRTLPLGIPAQNAVLESWLRNK